MTDASRSASVLGVVVAFVLVLAGCVGVVPINPPIEQVRVADGYRLSRLLKPVGSRRHDPEALVLLAFSGGGTRAAALSYGVLEELRRTPITVQGQPRSRCSTRSI